jgi:SAM-dependent methyltransferase
MANEEFSTISSQLEHTGERLVPAFYPGHTLQEHAARYVFAANYCKGKDVLDVASGLGYGTDYLRRYGAKTVGLERDDDAVRYSAEQYPSSKYVKGNAEQMPEDWTETFDVIVSFETIEHLQNPEQFVREVSRCLRPQGLFICSTPNKGINLLQGNNPFHVKEFTLPEFCRLIECRLRISATYGQSFHSRSYVIFSICRALARKILRRFRIPPLGIGAVFDSTLQSSPFEGNSIIAEKVASDYIPSPLNRKSVPGFLLVVAEKTSK